VRCEYAHDDGAYVLGALSPSERAAYERHLSDCPACREAVAEIAVLPGLLSRLDPVAAKQLLGPPATAEGAEADEGQDRPLAAAEGPTAGGDARIISLVDAAAQSRRRDKRIRRFRYAGSALAAACLALVAALGVGMLRNDTRGDGQALLPPPPPTTPQAPQVVMNHMKPLVPGAPVTAQIGIKYHDWGTEIVMDCQYKADDDDHTPWTFKMFAYGPDHSKEQLGSWVAGPGAELSLGGATRFTHGQLTRLEVAKADGTPVLSYQVN
jgi:hypothetical protein